MNETPTFHCAICGDELANTKCNRKSCTVTLLQREIDRLSTHRDELISAAKLLMEAVTSGARVRYVETCIKHLQDTITGTVEEEI